MENCLDIILQAIYYKVSEITPTYNGKLFLRFPEIGNKIAFLERLSTLRISYIIGHNDEDSPYLTITV